MSNDSDLHFSNNYRDLCIQSGTGAGFQFEFYCQCCSDTWRSSFEPYRSGQASGWMREAGGLLGGLFGGFGNQLDNAAEGLARAGWGTSRDAAFKTAIGSAQAHFHRCASCHRYSCSQCWSPDTGLCQSCAPDLAAQVRVARHAGTMEAATDAAKEAGKGQAADVEINAARTLVCPECHTETHGAKFCPQCGHNLTAKTACGHCKTELPAGSRFCPECGQAASGG
ncbi:zinc ribbon domain-containing protein [Ralstonia sp. UBA689]|uniref:zinc ribbon domain-containing protein n=1 Tax=Ralstonia sp. UBA689 TaxID=1947373 RepID=UPI0025F4202F|nr:zinc ribbon domain-containing protein [Ralstonia sp. UBA689]